MTWTSDSSGCCVLLAMSGDRSAWVALRPCSSMNPVPKSRITDRALRRAPNAMRLNPFSNGTGIKIVLANRENLIGGSRHHPFGGPAHRTNGSESSALADLRITLPLEPKIE